MRQVMQLVIENLKTAFLLEGLNRLTDNLKCCNLDVSCEGGSSSPS